MQGHDTTRFQKQLVQSGLGHWLRGGCGAVKGGVLVWKAEGWFIDVQLPIYVQGQEQGWSEGAALYMGQEAEVWGQGPVGTGKDAAQEGLGIGKANRD